MPLLVPADAQRKLSEESASISTDHVSPDTGRMLPAYDDWTPYRTVGMCLAAMRNIQHIENRSALDTINDTISVRLSPKAESGVLKCLEPFQVEELDRDELWAALRISLWLGDDEQSIRIIDRQLSLISSGSVLERAETLRRAVEYAITSPSPRERIARESSLRLASLGDSARSSRMLTHASLVDFYANTLADGEAALDHADSVQALERSLSKYDSVQGILSAQTVAQQAKLAMMNGADPHRVLDFLTRNTDSDPEDQSSALVEYFRAKYVEPIGSVVQAQEVSCFFPQNSSVFVRDTVIVPVSSVISLWIAAPSDWRNESKEMLLFASALRNIQRRYGRGTDITVFIKTEGYVPGSGALGLEEEIDAIRRYFITDHNLDVALAIMESPIEHLPDGRRVVGSVGYESLFGSGFKYSQMIVADANGRYLRIIDRVAPGMLFDRLLEEMFKVAITH